LEDHFGCTTRENPHDIFLISNGLIESSLEISSVEFYRASPSNDSAENSRSAIGACQKIPRAFV
jgi:hypothetical protein